MIKGFIKSSNFHVYITFKTTFKARFLFKPLWEFWVSHFKDRTRCLLSIDVPTSSSYSHMCSEQTLLKISVPLLSFAPHLALPHNSGISCIHTHQSLIAVFQAICDGSCWLVSSCHCHILWFWGRIYIPQLYHCFSQERHLMICPKFIPKSIPVFIRGFY